MEYVQMTLTDWMEVKHRLKMELQGVTRSFVRIGYVLRKIEEQRLYENDGYKSVAEFAKAEYGLEASTVSRFMSINREYSIDGYSEHLREEYIDMSRSQLEEMLKLPVADRTMIQPETARDDIRELKKFNKTEPVAGVADDITQLIEKFYEDNPEVLNELFDTETHPREQSAKRAIEVVNPGGNRSYKKGMFFLMMYENKIVIKKFGTTPEEMTWGRFFEITFSIFEDYGPKTWEKHFGKELEPVAVEKEKNEPVAVQEEPAKPMEKAPENEIARAQKTEENQGFEVVSEEEKECVEEAAEEAVQEDANGDSDGRNADDGQSGICGDMQDHQEMREREERADDVAKVVETPQSNEESGKEKEFLPVRSVKELEETVVSENDYIRRTFTGFSRGKVPLGELEVARDHAIKVLDALEQLIYMKKGE